MEELLKQIEEWNEAGEYSRAIGAIEAVPEGERGYALTLWLGRITSNLAVLGEHDCRQQKNAEPDWGLLRKAVDILETIQEEGEKDPVWNCRMGYALHTMDRTREAIQYGLRWQELAPEDPDAGEFVENCRIFLKEMTKGKKKD